MIKNYMLTCSVLLLFLGCMPLNNSLQKNNLQNYKDKGLVRWYRGQFLPKIRTINKNSNQKLNVKNIEKNNFIGIKISSYTIKNLKEEKIVYGFLHNESLRIYINYIEKRKGKIKKYKPVLTKIILNKLNILNKNNLTQCNYKNIYLSKINNELHSIFIDVNCLYTIKDVFNSKDIKFLKEKGLKSALEHKEMEGIIGVINAEESRLILNQIPNSIFDETIIKY